MVALYVITLSRKGLGDAGHHAFLIAEIIALFGFVVHRTRVAVPEIKIGRHNVAGDVARVGSHRNRLEKHFRAGHSASDIKHDATLRQSGCLLSVDEEVSAGTASLGLAVEGRVLVDDIRSYADVNSERNVIFVAGSEDTNFGMSEIVRRILFRSQSENLVSKLFVANHPAQGFAATKFEFVTHGQSVVEIGKFVGHPKLALTERIGDILTGLADQSQLEIVNGRSAVASHETYETMFHEFGKQRAKSVFYQVSTRKQNDRFVGLPGCDYRPRDGLDISGRFFR